MIVEEVNRLNGVVSAFLDYSRPLKQTFGPTDLQEVVTPHAQADRQRRPQDGDASRKSCRRRSARVDADAEQLKQVLINLVQNAVQAMGDKPGEIIIRTSKPGALRRLPRAASRSSCRSSTTGPAFPPISS